MSTKAIWWAAACAAAMAAGYAGAQKAQDEHAMTYTGCVEAAKQGGDYTLTHVMMGAPGAAAEQGAGKAPAMIDLTSASVKIAPHAGHKVTVMGKAMKDGEHTKLMVDSLKMVSTTCP